MMTLPSEGYGEGRFDRAKKFTVFNSAGDVVENGDLPPTERMVSLNGMALGECLGKSAAIAKGENWGFTFPRPRRSFHLNLLSYPRFFLF